MVEGKIVICANGLRELFANFINPDAENFVNRSCEKNCDFRQFMVEKKSPLDISPIGCGKTIANFINKIQEKIPNFASEFYHSVFEKKIADFANWPLKKIENFVNRVVDKNFEFCRLIVAK